MDMVTLTSPSAVQNFTELIGFPIMCKLANAHRLASIGPTTSKAITDVGWEVAVEAKESTAKGLVAAIVAHFKKPAARSHARMTFPLHRPRRLRRNEAIRSLVRETRLTIAGFIYPMFVCPGTNVRQEVSSMPGIFQQSVDKFLEECSRSRSLGIPGIILFGLPEHKDATGTNPQQQTAQSNAPSKPSAKQN